MPPPFAGEAPTAPPAFSSILLSPSSTVSLALYWSLQGKQIRGGAAGISKALLTACEKAGVTLHTNARVDQIIMSKPAGMKAPEQGGGDDD